MRCMNIYSIHQLSTSHWLKKQAPDFKRRKTSTWTLVSGVPKWMGFRVPFFSNPKPGLKHHPYLPGLASDSNPRRNSRRKPGPVWQVGEFPWTLERVEMLKAWNGFRISTFRAFLFGGAVLKPVRNHLAARKEGAGMCFGPEYVSRR